MVRDINANGIIDSGRELFGDQTRLSNGQLASNGFAALSDLDKDANGVADDVIDANDAAYAELRVWRDLNQDGISQAEELQTLEQAGITSINLTANAQGKSTFTKDGVVNTVQNVNFSTNAFYREFTDDPVVTETAALLPQMQGAGLVRDLREAMSLGTAQSATLEQTLNTFKAAGSAQDRQALLDQVIKAWAATSSQPDATTRNPATTGTWYNATVGDAIAAYAKAKPAEYAMMTALERFNAQPLLERYTRQHSAAYYEPSEQRWKGYVYYAVELEAPRLAFFSQAYQSLKATLYHNLYLQTTGKDLLDQVGLRFDGNGIGMDFSILNSIFATKVAQVPANAVMELAEFIYFTNYNLLGSGWDGAVQLADLLESTPLDAAQNAILAGFNYKFAGAIGDTADTNLGGSYDADVLVGRSGHDKLSGGSGDDILIGGQGNDVLIGGYGDDQLMGGQGNDYMDGQAGTDTYFWGQGQGNDTIHDGYVNGNEQNSVVLRGLNPQDVRIELLKAEDYTRFKVTILSSGETLTLDTNSYYDWGSFGAVPMRLLFADGTEWDLKQVIRQALPMATDGNDVLIGTPFDDIPDRLNGGAGNDIIVGRGGADIMEGGSGDDMLYGNATLGRRYVDGVLTPVTWWFDAASSSDGDVYVFGRGDGRDTIFDQDYGANEDVLRFKEGILFEDLELAQRGDDLVIKVKETSDQVTVKSFFVVNPYWWQSSNSTPFAIERFDFADGTQWDLNQIKEAAWAGTTEDDNFMGDGRANHMAGGAGNDVLSAQDGDDILDGGDGNDILDGGYGDDVITGGMGSDVLSGGGGDDVLDGGAGNDVINAGQGADIIRFGRGDGKDALNRDLDWSSYFSSYYSGQSVNPGGNNVVELKAGVDPVDVKLVRNGTSLAISIKGTDDVLTVKDFYVVRNSWEEPVNANFSLREIRFADGTVWTPEIMLAQTLIGDQTDETFTGFANDETFDGGGGNDKFFGNGGDDTFRFGRGDGADKVVTESDSLNTLAFKDGVSADDVMVRRVGNHAAFTIRGTGDSVTFENAFLSYWWNPSTGVQSMAAVTFADGSSWSIEQINQKAIEGTAQDDVIRDVPISSQTVLAGGAGNDTLIGDRGTTIYVFNRGDGQDTLDEAYSYSNGDTLRFGPDIVATDLVVTKQGDDLVIGIAGTADQVTIKNRLNSGIENVEVGGITLSYQQILDLIEESGSESIFGSSGNDVLTGTAKASNISGFAGDDVLIGNAGADILDGGEGNDSLYGNDGDDTILAGNGDDRLAGGAQRDQLDAGLGANTYVYNRGDALDTITLTPGASDVLELGEGITAPDLTVQVANADVWNGHQMVRQMVIGVGGNDALLLEIPAGSDFSTALESLATVRFADGTTMSYADLLAKADAGVIGYNYQYGDSQILTGSQADDYITVDGAHAYLDGRGNSDYLNAYGVQALLAGGDGVDTLNADAGGAVMAGGRGADQVNASSWGEANTVAFNLGDGKDRIDGGAMPGVLSFGAGIDPASVRMRVDGSGDLVISIAGSEGDEIRTSWYQDDQGTPYDSRAIDKLQFVDEDGKTRLFDLSGLDARFDVSALSSASLGDGLDVLAQAPELEIDTPSPVYGGAAAIAYAQTGNMLEDAYIAANSDLSGDNILFGTPDADTLNAGDGNDRVMANEGDDTLLGEAGNDYLDGQAGDDVLIGGTGDDVLVGGSGNDVLDAGTGNNKALGGDGDDTYLYARGNGFLYIDDGMSFDGGEGGYGGGSDYNKLVFGESITLEDLLFERDGNDLKVTIAGADGDTVVMAGFDEYLESRNRSIDEFVFQDGTSVALQDLWGQNSDSYLVSSGDGDLTGTDLRDDLRGGLGDDRLEGGAGDDRLQGGAGNDAYVLGYGSGDDVIVDKAGEDNIIVVSDGSVTADDVHLQTENGEAGIWLGDRYIKLEGWDGQDISQAPISSVLLADGSTLDMEELLNNSRDIVGTPQADVLQGGTGSDWIWGLGGDDLMMGGGGADTYVIEEDSGADTVTDTSTPGEENSIIFLDGIQPEDIRLTIDQNHNLVLQWWDGSQVTLTEFDYQDPLDEQSVMYFQFGWGGPVLSYEELLERGFEIDGTAQNDVLSTTGLHDTVHAGEGDDVIAGSAGDDVLYGGSGNDAYEYRLGDGYVQIFDVADETGANVVRFGEGITPEMLDHKLRFTVDPDNADNNRFQIVFDGDNILELSGFDPQVPDTSNHAVEYFEFSDGTVLNWSQMLDIGFVLEGDDSGNIINGTNRNDRLYGYEGDDLLVAGDGNDVLTGGGGTDTLDGGHGNDNYVFNLGDGNDTIEEDGAGGNVITFGEGVFDHDISVERDGADYVVRYGAGGDSIRLASVDGVNTPSGVIDHFELADGTLIPFAQFINHVPEVGDLLLDQQGRVGEEFVFDFSGGAFIDPDGTELSYRAQLSTGDALPDWLSFNPMTRAFAGTPPLDAAGNYEVVVFAVDDSGMAMQQSFSFEVANQANHAPAAMEDQAAVQEDLVTLASGSVLSNDSDVDAATVLTVTNAGVLQGVWGQLELNADGSYVYRLDNESVQVQSLKNGQVEADVFVYSVTDGADTVSSQLTVSIAGTNDLPVVTADTGQVVEDGAGELTGFVLGNDHDIDGDVLNVVEAGVWTGQHGTLTLNADGSYKYVLDNDSAAVQGLQAGQVISDVFAFNVSDGLAATGSSLSISIVGTNDGPRVLADVAGVFEDTQPTAGGNVLANDVDADAGTVLSVADAGTLTGQYGTLTLGTDGQYSYTVLADPAVQSLAAGQTVTDIFSYTASDGTDAASTTLTVTLTGENDAPILAQAIAAQTGREGQAFNFVLAANAFVDLDQGDALAYSISLANGDPLPSWLSFDPVSRLLSGTPGSSDSGTLSLKVTASDISGASASSVFALSIEDGVCTGGGVYNGTAQNDNINGSACADVINGNAGDDQLYGNGGNDVLNGGLGADFVSGGAGNDSVQMSIDAVWGRGNSTANRGSPDACGGGAQVSLSGLNRTRDIVDGGAGWDSFIGTSGSDAIILDAGSNAQASLRDIEQFDLGAGNDVLNLTSTRFDYGSVVVTGGTGNDTIWTGAGSDRIYGGAGRDNVDAGAGDDFVDGGDQDDRLISLLGYGNDIIRGGAGNDTVADMAGQNLLDGGSGADVIADGNGNSILVGGRGDDVLKLGRGSDVILFNRGDGRDAVIGGNESLANDTLVLGGGIRYQDLAFRKDGDDLLLNIGQDGCAADRIRFVDWYCGNKTVDRLEIAIDASADYILSSQDGMDNQRVQSFDFSAIVARFEAERSMYGCGSGQPVAQSWALSSALVAFHLGGSDSQIMGGDVSDYYAHQGTLSGLSLGVAQATLASGQLGSAQQTINPLAVQAAGAVRL